MLAAFVILLPLGLIVFYVWQKHHYNHWQRRGVPFIRPTPIVGNFQDLSRFKKNIGTQLQSLYETAGFETAPIVGIFVLLRPALLIRDLQLVKKVMIKDFAHFPNRVLGADAHHDPLGYYNLFFVHTPMWRELRTKLSPVFTSGKMKQMYPLLAEVGKELDSYLKSYADGSIVEMREICSRFTVELIGTSAFGVRTNSLWNPQTEFYRHSRAIFALTLQRAFSFFITLVAPALAPVFRTKVFSDEVSHFMAASVRHVMAEREKSGQVRNDLIDTLLEMKREAEANPSLACPARNFEVLVAQAMVFQTAGFETSSSTMAFALYELAKDPHVQAKLRSEVLEAFEEHGDWISYERIQAMPYLGMVVDETLRKYPTVAFLERECLTEQGAPYMLTDDLAIPSGTAVYVSNIALHYDTKYWPEPQKFDPERFAPENRDNINRDAYMPFGVGPRNCIGMRLGLLQTKLGLVHLLRSHRVAVCDETPQHIDFDPKAPVLSQKGGLTLKLQRC